MNKQMTPAEIEVLQQSFARFAPLSEKATLVGIESGPLPPPNIPAALALAGMTMKSCDVRFGPEADIRHSIYERWFSTASFDCAGQNLAIGNY